MLDLLRDNAEARRLILERLYSVRLGEGAQEVGGFVPRRRLADLAPHIDFLLHTLAEQGLVSRDGDRWRITGAGCAHLESTVDKE
ncbi:hypothetical protein [Azohydromonas sediminis]|uniref:hypothetical protein n=1 Tax=Azohydromonas sediminis TaxID=2259674 RepID=UPI000E64D884|nr:hypothetical protein [Azohydromonas sediminis]